MTDERNTRPDPELDPVSSPGFGAERTDLSELEVTRDVTLGTATPKEFTATDTEPVAEATLDELCERLENGDRIERRRAAVALSKRSPTATAVDPLSNAALEDADSDVRQFAVEALAIHADQSAVSDVRRVASDEDPWVRAEAIVALDTIDPDGNLEFFEAKLEDEHSAVRRNAMIALYKSRGDDALETLLSGLDDPDDRVREWAVELLGGVDGERARRALLRAQSADESDIVRVTAAKALGNEQPLSQTDRVRSSGANVKQTPGSSLGSDDADDLNDLPDL